MESRAGCGSHPRQRSGALPFPRRPAKLPGAIPDCRSFTSRSVKRPDGRITGNRFRQAQSAPRLRCAPNGDFGYLFALHLYLFIYA